jgi:hypothetical protein
VGVTNGSLAGTHKGSGDVYIRKYDPGGGHVWTRQFGTTTSDYGNAIAVYGNSVYVVGTLGSSSFLRRYTTDGRLVWSVPNNPYADVAVDSRGDVYTVGSGRGMVIRKYDSFGYAIWNRRVDNSGQGTAVAVSGNSVYLVGNYLWNNTAGDTNVAVTKFTTDGTQLWSNAYGAYGWDFAWDASVDSYGYLYFTGYTGTPFAGPNQGGMDGYVVKISHTGYWQPLWSKTIGTSSGDLGFAVVARPLNTRTCAVAVSDSCNQIYMAGYTYGSIPYVGNRGKSDAYLRRLYSGDGGTVWTK